jgi:hypothetical protein
MKERSRWNSTYNMDKQELVNVKPIKVKESLSQQERNTIAAKFIMAMSVGRGK